jgi:hypothetical protein
MYAFATESMYGVLIKDAFGYGEDTLSLLFAINGVCVGIFQLLFIKPMIDLFGKHMTLLVGKFGDQPAYLCIYECTCILGSCKWRH